MLPAKENEEKNCGEKVLQTIGKHRVRVILFVVRISRQADFHAHTPCVNIKMTIFSVRPAVFVVRGVEREQIV